MRRTGSGRHPICKGPLTRRKPGGGPINIPGCSPADFGVSINGPNHQASTPTPWAPLSFGQLPCIKGRSSKYISFSADSCHRLFPSFPPSFSSHNDHWSLSVLAIRTPNNQTRTALGNKTDVELSLSHSQQQKQLKVLEDFISGLSVLIPVGDLITDCPQQHLLLRLHLLNHDGICYPVAGETPEASRVRGHSEP